MPSVLSAGQYQIARYDNSKTLTYGAGAGSIQVVSTAIAPGSMVLQDQAVVGHDGVLFGVDTMGGATITQNGICMTTPATGNLAMDAYDALAAIWNDPGVRLANNAVQVLRFLYRGSSVTRRVYGRGRAITPTYGQVFNGLVGFTAQFQCADGNIYEDTINTVNLTMNPGGIRAGVAPIAAASAPMVATTWGPTTAVITVGGTVPTWPVITFGGPVNNPTLTFIGSGIIIGYTGTIASGQSVVIDTRPWARTMMLGGASVAGNLYGTTLISMQMWPGTVTVQFEGNFTSQAGLGTCQVQWSNAVQALGGSI